MSHNLPQDLTKLGYTRKISKFHIIIGSCVILLLKLKCCQYQQKSPEKEKLNFSRSRLFHVKTTQVCLKYFVNCCRAISCSYGNELARLSGLAHPGETSPSLTNSYENIMRSYEKLTSLPRWDLTLFCRCPTQVR